MSVSSDPMITTSAAGSQESQSHGSSISSGDDATTSKEPTGSEADTDSSTYEQRIVTGLCKKRKLEASVGNDRKKRYNDHYRRLVNDTINTAAGLTTNSDYERALPSQHGVSWWTADEKAIMFDVLARKGENEICAIAAAIGTKTEMEVRVYLQSIRTASETRLNQPRADRLSLIDIPAAVEIGEECCSVLDQHAQSLASLQQTHEAKVEQQKHAELWLLTRDIAQSVEDHLEDEDLEGADIRERLPAATLLNLPNWLNLSERIFMNPASPREDENWRAIAEGMDTPSIMNTAFSDFHALAFSITKRLVQSSLFYAMSRLRATDSSRYRYRPLVRAKDVRVAVQILGMRATTYDFWTRAPRRCNLHIYQGRQKARILDYNQVERLLSQEEVDEQHNDRQTDSTEKDFAEHESDNNIEAAFGKDTATKESEHEASCRTYSLSGSNDSTSMDEEGQVETKPERGSKQHRAQPQPECDEDEYAEIFDQQVSQAEEKRILETLGESPTSGVKAEIPDLPKRSGTRGKASADFVHWRDEIEFWGEWEVFKSPVPHDRFDRKRRRDGLHDRDETYEAEALISCGFYGTKQTGDVEEDGGRAVERARIAKGNDFTAVYSSTGSAGDDVTSSSNASEGRSCRGDLVEHRSELLADVNRGDPSLSPGSDDEDRGSVELDTDPENQVHDKGIEEYTSDGGVDSSVSTPGSEVASTSASTTRSSEQSPL